MQDNPITDHTDNRSIGLDLDRDDWESALKPYKGDPHAAALLMVLAFIFSVVLEPH